jgi:predicted NAD/FAD-binding protein
MKVAIVGAGISGLGAAYLLSRAHEVEVFERASYAGGHTNTVLHDGLALDTGFLVHNERNYPLLCRLFRELGIRTQDSEMSFSVSAGGLEYSGRHPFAQKRNAASPRFLALVWEIGRWLRTASPPAEELTLADYVQRQGFSERFRRLFLVPLTAALWSTAPDRALDFPAAYAIRFFEHHGMLGFGRPRWRTVTGGSQSYVRALLERLDVHVGLGARSLCRDPDGVTVTTDDGETRRYDAAVVATHADQALALLEDPSDDERRVLGAFRYTRNDTVLHTDSSFLPETPAARASWNYRWRETTKPTLTYYLNRLQRLEAERDYCVTLNQHVPEEHVLRRIVYEHPLYTVESMRAQVELPALSGRRRTWYAGAHHGNGFHEDGFASGVRAAAGLGVGW